METLGAILKFIFGMIGFAVAIVVFGIIAKAYYALFMLGWGALS